MRPHPKEPAISRADAASMWLFIVAAIAFAVFTLVRGILRVIELVHNSSVTVPATFADTTAGAPIGVDGTTVEVTLEEAMLTVEALPTASVWAGILEVVTILLATTIVVICLVLLCRELLAGRIFSRRNTRIALTAGITWLVGLALAPFFGNMVANGAFAVISERTFNNVVMTVDVQTLFTAAFVAALVASIFAVGDRLQRDQEGLV